MNETGPRHAAWLHLALAVVLAALLIGLRSGLADSRELTGTASHVFDYVNYYRPNAEYLGARLARGELPLWNPRQALGGPFAATLQPGALYPASWVHAFLPAGLGFGLGAVLHLALAGFFTGALARRLGASMTGAWLAGILFATGVRVLHDVWAPPALHAAAWLPAIWWGADRLAKAPGPRRCATLAVFVALLLLTGWPLMAVTTALVVGPYAAMAALETLRNDRVRGLGSLAGLAGAAGVGALLAAPLLLPGLELTGLSCRAFGSLSQAQSVFVAQPYDPANFLSILARTGTNDAIPSIFALPLLVLAFAVPPPRRIRVVALASLGVLLALASFPNHLPVYDWLRELPAVGSFRFPFRLRVVTALSVAVLAGVGLGVLEAWVGGGRRGRVVAVAALVVTLAPALVSAVVRGTHFPLLASFSPTLQQTLMVPGMLPEVHGLDRALQDGRSEKLGRVSSRDVLQDLEPLTLARTGEVLTYLGFGLPRTVEGPPGSGHVEPPYFGLVTLPDTPDRAPLLDLLSVRYVLARRPPSWLGERYRVLRRALGTGRDAVSLFENEGALPRAYRVRSAELAPRDLTEALDRLVAPDFDPRRSVLLDVLPPGLAGPDDLLPDDPAAGVRVESYEAEQISLSTWGSGPGVVVVTDAHYPGWIARVDGRAAPLLRANTAVRAVVVEPGEHEIELLYRPASFRLGLGLAALGAAALVSLWLAALRSARVVGPT